MLFLLLQMPSMLSSTAQTHCSTALNFATKQELFCFRRMLIRSLFSAKFQNSIAQICLRSNMLSLRFTAALPILSLRQKRLPDFIKRQSARRLMQLSPAMLKPTFSLMKNTNSISSKNFMRFTPILRAER